MGSLLERGVWGDPGASPHQSGPKLPCPGLHGAWDPPQGACEHRALCAPLIPGSAQPCPHGAREGVCGRAWCVPAPCQAHTPLLPGSSLPVPRARPAEQVPNHRLLIASSGQLGGLPWAPACYFGWNLIPPVCQSSDLGVERGVWSFCHSKHASGTLPLAPGVCACSVNLHLCCANTQNRKQKTRLPPSQLL